MVFVIPLLIFICTPANGRVHSRMLSLTHAHSHTCCMQAYRREDKSQSYVLYWFKIDLKYFSAIHFESSKFLTLATLFVSGKKLDFDQRTAYHHSAFKFQV